MKTVRYYKNMTDGLKVPDDAIVIQANLHRKPHIILEGKEYKHCAKCGVFMPLNKFYQQGARWDGLHDLCKECVDESKRRN